MTPNKKTVRKFMEAFSRSNYSETLSCLTEDVEWVVPGLFHRTGKVAFDHEIENGSFMGKPVIQVSRMTEENDVVIVEGSLRSTKKEGGILNAVFCNVFVMRDAKVRHLTSYLMEIKG